MLGITGGAICTIPPPVVVVAVAAAAAATAADIAAAAAAAEVDDEEEEEATLLLLLPVSETGSGRNSLNSSRRSGSLLKSVTTCLYTSVMVWCSFLYA